MASGLLINHRTFELLFSQNTLRHIKKFPSSIFEVKVVLKMGKYLETFMDSKMNCKENFQDIIAKITKKLQDCKGNLLSQTRGHTLCAKVLQSLLVSHFTTSNFPKKYLH